MSRGPSEFLPLSEAGVRAAWGPNGRHAALFEDAFHVLLETPGGGVTLNGKADSRRKAKQALEIVAGRADQGLEVAQADVRVAIDRARQGAGGGGPIGRRGAVAAKTAAQARYLDLLNEHELVFSLGPAGTGKTFLAVAHGAGLPLAGGADRLVITCLAVEAGERLGFLPGAPSWKTGPTSPHGPDSRGADRDPRGPSSCGGGVTAARSRWPGSLSCAAAPSPTPS